MPRIVKDMQRAGERDGTKILRARNALNMTLAELAERSETSASYLNRVERGERIPTNRWLRKVTQALFAAMAEEGAA